MEKFINDMNRNELFRNRRILPKFTSISECVDGTFAFAAWVIQVISPRIFVELGTHSGNSYFSFCQSVIEAGISSKCYAVDTWKGDEHASYYDEEVFTKVSAYHEEHYAGFSRLLRMTFDNAVIYFSDESVNLFHIRRAPYL